MDRVKAIDALNKVMSCGIISYEVYEELQEIHSTLVYHEEF